MPQRRLRTISAHQAVPPGHIETKVAVGLDREYGMMNSVHIRSYHKKAKKPIQTEWKPYVPMIEHGCSV